MLEVLLGEYEQGEAHLDQAIARDHGLGATVGVAWGRLLRADLHVARGRRGDRQRACRTSAERRATRAQHAAALPARLERTARAQARLLERAAAQLSRAAPEVASQVIVDAARRPLSRIRLQLQVKVAELLLRRQRPAHHGDVAVRVAGEDLERTRRHVVHLPLTVGHEQELDPLLAGLRVGELDAQMLDGIARGVHRDPR